MLCYKYIYKIKSKLYKPYDQSKTGFFFLQSAIVVVFKMATNSRFVELN